MTLLEHAYSWIILHPQAEARQTVACPVLLWECLSNICIKVGLCNYSPNDRFHQVSLVSCTGFPMCLTRHAVWDMRCPRLLCHVWRAHLGWCQVLVIIIQSFCRSALCLPLAVIAKQTTHTKHWDTSLLGSDFTWVPRCCWPVCVTVSLDNHMRWRKSIFTDFEWAVGPFCQPKECACVANVDEFHLNV